MHPIPSCRRHPDLPNAPQALFGVCETTAQRLVRPCPGLSLGVLAFSSGPLGGLRATAPFSRHSLGTRPRENNRFLQVHTQLDSPKNCPMHFCHLLGDLSLIFMHSRES